MSLLAVIVGVLSALLSLLSSHYTYHSYALPILRTLLSPQWTHHLNLYVSGQHTELVLVTLKLFNTLSNFAGGKARKAVLDAFAWEMKVRIPFERTYYSANVGVFSPYQNCFT